MSQWTTKLGEVASISVWWAIALCVTHFVYSFTNIIIFPSFSVVLNCLYLNLRVLTFFQFSPLSHCRESEWTVSGCWAVWWVKTTATIFSDLSIFRLETWFLLCGLSSLKIILHAKFNAFNLHQLYSPWLGVLNSMKEICLLWWFKWFYIFFLLPLGLYTQMCCYHPFLERFLPLFFLAKMKVFFNRKVKYLTYIKKSHKKSLELILPLIQNTHSIPGPLGGNWGSKSTPTAVRAAQVWDCLMRLNVHKPVGPGYMHPRILKELDDMSWSLSYLRSRGCQAKYPGTGKRETSLPFTKKGGRRTTSCWASAPASHPLICTTCTEAYGYSFDFKLPT